MDDIQFPYDQNYIQTNQLNQVAVEISKQRKPKVKMNISENLNLLDIQFKHQSCQIDNQLDIKRESSEAERQKNQQERIWRPVKLEQINKLPKLKFQYIQGSINPKKQIRRKNMLETDLSDPQQAKKHLKRLAKDYHKSLVEEVMERQRIQQKQGVKNQAQWITIDKNLRLFPLYNEKMKSKQFQSIDQFKTQLRKQQQQILSQLGDPHIISVFFNSYQQVVKRSSDCKWYYNFRCSIKGCNAMLKCSVDIEKRCCDLYLLRNKHNHTITGIIIEEEKPKVQIPVILDEELHQMFGFQKGVRSETQNIKYINPEQRKIKIARQKLESKERRKKQVESSVNGDDEQNNFIKQNQPRLLKKKKRRSLTAIKKKYYISKRPQNTQFKNMYVDLNAQNIKVEADSAQVNNQFLKIAVITKQQFIRSVTDPTTLRFIISDSLIKLDKIKQPQNNLWSIMLVTALNQALKPIVLAICISSQPIQSQILTIFQLLSKIIPIPKFLVFQYKSQLQQHLKTIEQKRGETIRILYDSNDILSILKKQLKEDKNIRVIKELMNPVNNYARKRYEKYLIKRNQKQVLEKFYQFKDYTLIDIENNSDFCGVVVDLFLERELIIKIKQRLKNGLKRHSLKLQLKTLIQVISQSNKSNMQIIKQEQILQIEKVHRDIQLQILRKSVTPQILNYFYIQYGEALLLEVEPSQQAGQFLFQKRKLKADENKCSCGYTKITGIPCRHLIRILKDVQKSYLMIFNKRWIVNNDWHKQDKISSDQRDRTRQKLLKKKPKLKKNQKQEGCQNINQKRHYNSSEKQQKSKQRKKKRDKDSIFS